MQVTRPFTGGGQLLGIGTLNDAGPTYAGMVVLPLKLVIVIPSDATLAVRYCALRVCAALEPLRAGYESRRTAVVIPADGLGTICAGPDDPVGSGTFPLPPPLHPARSVRAATEHSCLSNVSNLPGEGNVPGFRALCRCFEALRPDSRRAQVVGLSQTGRPRAHRAG